MNLQITTGRNDKGLKLYDPGYLNTAPVRSSICYIDGDEGILRYRGYPIEELAESSSFLEVAYLLSKYRSQAFLCNYISWYLIVRGDTVCSRQGSCDDVLMFSTCQSEHLSDLSGGCKICELILICTFAFPC